MKRLQVFFQNNILKFSPNIKERLDDKPFKTIYFEKCTDIKEQLEKNDFSIVILNSLDTLKEIKKFHCDKSTSFIVVLNDTSMMEHYLKEGATDFINISVLEEDLIPRINISFDKSLQIRNLLDLTNKDYLTNLYNKRYFYERAKRIYEKNQNIAICMIDIDDFKAINDTYGHLAGDYTIKELAKLLDKNIKGKDLAARFGGDEFCILFEDIDQANAKELITKIQNLANSHKITIHDKAFYFSISVGLNTEKGSSLEDMIHLADLNLYNQKLENKTKTYKKEEAVTA